MERQRFSAEKFYKWKIYWKIDLDRFIYRMEMTEETVVITSEYAESNLKNKENKTEYNE